MENNELAASQLRERMFVAGVTVSDLAERAGMPQTAMSAILAGRKACGPERQSRIEEAIVRLGLDCEPTPARPLSTFRIRRA